MKRSANRGLIGERRGLDKESVEADGDGGAGTFCRLCLQKYKFGIRNAA